MNKPSLFHDALSVVIYFGGYVPSLIRGVDNTQDAPSPEVMGVSHWTLAMFELVLATPAMKQETFSLLLHDY